MVGKFSYINDAALWLLEDVCNTLSKSSVGYVVAGGWVPVLKVKHSSLTHPGTRDVDVLLDDTIGAASSAVQKLISGGYNPSAKHEFQLLKEMEVDGQTLVFNVDLMHPIEAQNKGEDLFADIFDLGIKEDYNCNDSRMVKSICFPSSQIVFDEVLWSGFSLASGTQVPLLDEAAFILSKCDSVKSPKRRRDAFDIFYVLSGANGIDAASELISMSDKFPQVKIQLDLLYNFISKNESVFDGNVFKYCDKHKLSSPPSQQVKKMLFGSSSLN